MHNAALEHCGIEARYGRIHIRLEELGEALRLLPEQNFIGVNLTIPHKPAALALMDKIDEHARRMGAINTVVVEDGKLIGFNTDGPGIVRAIRESFSVDLRDLRVLILGAGGGAGRAIAVQCALENCERLVLTNRTFAKAQSLADELAVWFASPRVAAPVKRLRAIPWESIASEIPHVDLIINATSVGMKRMDSSPVAGAHLAPHLLVYDTIYTAERTKLMLAADEAGARSANGLSMLLHQGALAFEIWFNREAPLEVMRSALVSRA